MEDVVKGKRNMLESTFEENGNMIEATMSTAQWHRIALEQWFRTPHALEQWFRAHKRWSTFEMEPARSVLEPIGAVLEPTAAVLEATGAVQM